MRFAFLTGLLAGSTISKREVSGISVPPAKIPHCGEAVGLVPSPTMLLSLVSPGVELAFAVRQVQMVEGRWRMRLLNPPKKPATLCRPICETS